MKRILYSTLIVACLLWTASPAFSQIRFGNQNQTENGPGGPPMDDDVIDVNDPQLPIDQYVWVGLAIGALVGGVFYYRYNKQPA